ncbi:LacI family DNA-binding transcriptional regulator [Mucilaginibacter conchicola]|uniref:LacI family DNA-binding transcriptional regulator n=1 Tax=Mucilaginibacter conchicola TaxID=2303333 RepID=A0A372NRU3_9SPHI|nr:substrate-binding domain-containing protein [Mucilaginibacter conchicola]RFZ90993.1 LacI family DNA-binding transcriptional regulator [Mucilaginibacter conchicola]
MKKAATELTGVKEIARRANVSIGTVDRVIHNRVGVSEKTKQKVNAIIEELNFQPNKMASLLATRKSMNFAVLIPAVSADTDYWSFPLTGIEQAAAETKQFGVSVKHYFYDLDSKESFTKASHELLNDAPDAVLLAPSFVEESAVLAAKLDELKIPLVFINSDLADQNNLAYIGPDLYQSGRLAAQLISLSLQQQDNVLIVNISSDLKNDHHLVRKEHGFKKFFEDAGSKTKVATLNINETKLTAVEQSLMQTLDASPDVKAIFVTNSRVNIVAEILKKHNRNNTLLVGYDFLKKNIDYLVSQQITYLICQRPKEQGYLGIMALYKHLFKVSEVERSVYMPIDIITKENYLFYNS